MTDGACDGQLIVILNLCDGFGFDAGVVVKLLKLRTFFFGVLPLDVSARALEEALADANQSLGHFRPLPRPESTS